MEYRYVKSSNIEGVAYDKDTQMLHVRFKSGQTYKYHDVPEDEYAALVEAPSPGAYLNDNIKGIYSYEQV